MGGKLVTEKITLERAADLGGDLIARWRPFLAEGAVAGSVRRRASHEVGDVDLVVVPADANRLHELLDAVFGRQRSGKGVRRSGVIDGVQVDVVVTSTEEWGSALLHCTGSKQFNIRCRARAKSKGWKLSEKGLFDSAGNRVCPATSERKILETLGLGWIDPKDRR